MTDFIIMSADEFKKWLADIEVTRFIKTIQNHHTYRPGYSDFKNNHLQLLQSMERYHVENNGWDCIAQNITTFPDGKVAICRPFDKIPAGIKGQNKFGLCIEHLGNFDENCDSMTPAHRQTIIKVNAALCKKFDLNPEWAIVYHHWFDLITGKQTDGYSGNLKSCPGTGFFGGNTPAAFKKFLLPEVV